MTLFHRSSKRLLLTSSLLCVPVIALYYYLDLRTHLEHRDEDRSVFVDPLNISPPVPTRQAQLTGNQYDRTSNIYEARRYLAQYHCQNYTRRRPSDDAIYRRLFVDNKYKFLYCPIAKVGNTAWRSVMLVLRGAIENVSDLKRGGQVYDFKYQTLEAFSEKKRRERMQSFTKFVFVRHPFSRLLSAFRDKFEITAEKSFVNIYSPLVKRTVGRRDARKQIKFEEFVQYLLKTDILDYNVHWLPMHIVCHLCFLDYDIIGKSESLAEDADYVMKTIHASDAMTFPHYAPHATNSSSDDVMRSYYSRPTKSQIRGLYKKYEWDFKLFGYKLSDYNLEGD